MKKIIIAVLLILTCLASSIACASDSIRILPTRASNVFDEYGIGISAKSGCKIVVTADVEAIHIADKIGFPTVQIKELQDDGSWKVVQSKTDKYVYDRATHLITVSYIGTAGNSYKGYARYYGKIGDYTDKANLTSNIKQARN